MYSLPTHLPIRIPFTRTPEVEAALNTWNSHYKEQFSLLLIQYSKLHLAIHGQRPSVRLNEITERLSQWEDEMLNTVLHLDIDILPKLEQGLLKSTEQFEAAVRTLREHQANYSRLRQQFDAFLDSKVF